MILLPLLLAPTFRSSNGIALPKSKENFDFIALGDNRPAGMLLPITPVFRSIIKDVSVIDPDFILSSGDLLYGKDEPIGIFRQECLSMKKLLATLPCPIYNAPGNHEISDRADFYQEYRKQFGATYGSFTFGKWRFLEVSTEEVDSSPGIVEPELGWLKEMLGKPEPKIVFHHHPVYGRKSNAEEGAIIKDAPQIADLYRSGGVRYVFQGHDHVFNHQTHDGVEYYISGGAGAPLDANPDEGGFYHYSIVHVRGEKVTVDTVAADSLQIVRMPNGIMVGNGSNADLHLRNLVVKVSRRPSQAEGTELRKKAPKVEVKIADVKKVAGGYLVRLELTAPKHRGIQVKISSKNELL